MKVAVTGATGFIGRPALKELAGQAVEVIAVIRPSAIEGAPCVKLVVAL